MRTHGRIPEGPEQGRDDLESWLIQELNRETPWAADHPAEARVLRQRPAEIFTWLRDWGLSPQEAKAEVEKIPPDPRLLM